MSVPYFHVLFGRFSQISELTFLLIPANFMMEIEKLDDRNTREPVANVL